MINPSVVLTEADVRHLLRRTGFGPTAKDIKRAKLVGKTRGEAADEIVNYKPKKIRLKGKSEQEVHDKWVKFLLKGRNQFQSKLALFFHDHFSTSISQINRLDEMANQIETIYANANGNFLNFVKAINLDPAMMRFLDTDDNRKEIPNENYARELCELFTLGVFDSAGNPNYLQEDVVQIARAFTGWDYDDDTLQPFMRESRHDYMEEFDGDPEEDRGPKVLFKGAHGFPAGGADFAANGEGEPEVDTVTDILFQHTDTDGMNTVARRTTRRLLEYFTHATPDLTTIDECVSDSGFDSNWSIAGLCRSIITHDDFWNTGETQPFDASTRKSVKHPIDYVVSTLRICRVKPKGKSLELQGGGFDDLHDHLRDMGQIITDPPSVFGWDWEEAWLSSSTLLARYTFARDIVAARFGGGRLKVKKLIDLSLTDPVAIVDAVLELFGVLDQVTANEKAVLQDYLTDTGLNPSIDLNNEDVVNTKLHGLLALVMQSPIYQMQ